MSKALGIAIFVAVGVLLRMHFQQTKEREAAREDMVAFAADPEKLQPEIDESQSPRIENPSRVSSEPRACDGRRHCSQMKSCEEATWFIEHCPGTEMDGDNDGIPCESQWCKQLSSK